MWSSQHHLTFFFSAESIEIRWLGENLLTGRIPDTICDLTLASIRLGGNDFSCPYPTCCGCGLFPPCSPTTTTLTLHPLQAQALTDMQQKWGAQLGWYGSAQTSACSTWVGITCTAVNEQQQVRALVLHNQGLMGEIPSTIGNLINLQHLDLSSNPGLVGSTIPTSIASIGTLSWLDLSGCNLTGTIPAGFGTLPNLKLFYLSYNQLNGSLPSFSPNSSIVELYADSNGLSGPLPATLADLRNLNKLYLQSNRLTGSVPNIVCTLSGYNLERNLWSRPLPACNDDTGN